LWGATLIKIYYDGLCHLCSREISHYAKQPGSENIAFCDITAKNFDPIAEGLDPKRVHKEMHVKKSDGTLAIGVEAFIAIWETLPKYHFAAVLAKRALPNLILRGGYQVFAKIRPWLPKRKESCALPTIKKSG
jgi:predicted DCC family thiol-disulfide oxidoreductase YuxK